MRADAARNNARILEAARELVRTDGPAVAMDDIAAAAGVAVGTLYRHHPTKAALLEALVADGLEEWARQAEAGAADVTAGRDPGDVLAGMVRRIAVMHAEDQVLKATAAALGARVPDPLGPMAAGSPEQRTFAAVEAVLEAARRSGAVRADLGVADLVLLINGAPGTAAAAERYADLVIGGLVHDRMRRRA